MAAVAASIYIFVSQARLSEAQRAHAAALQQLEAAHAKSMKKQGTSHAAAMSKVQTEAEAQLGSLTQQMEQLKRDVQAQLAERTEAGAKQLKDLEDRCGHSMQDTTALRVGCLTSCAAAVLLT
jgi:hypothetical protein